MSTPNQTDDHDARTDDEPPVTDHESPTDTVTPDAVAGDVDYDQLLAEFGADRFSEEQRSRFPDPSHPLVRRGVYYAGRDVDPFLDAVESGEPHSIVTGIGPSGPMHLGHLYAFSVAKYLQERTGATVYIPLSDDEKYFTKDLSLDDIAAYTRENLLDLLAFDFDPERTRFVIDTADADVVYPVATALAKGLTQSTVEATYGPPDNVGQSFYPAVQATHLLLPQLVEGRHRTLVPIAVDQDPHVRVCRDLAAKERYDVTKPGALLSKFLPGLAGPGKMSASDETPKILLTDDRETVREKIHTHAFSGGQSSLEAHRREGGDPAVDVSFQYLAAFFEDDDAEVERLAREYRAGDLLSGELKAIAVETIADYLDAHQARRPAAADLESALEPYRLTDDERRMARRRVGYPDESLAQE
jgi:tryptophanyl-tRNA synthetase